MRENNRQLELKLTTMQVNEKVKIHCVQNMWVAPPFGHQNSLNLLGYGLYKVSKAFHRDADPCWLQCFPQLSSWLDVLFVFDPSWYTQETVECEKLSSVAVLNTVKPVRLALTIIPRSKSLQSFVLPIQPLNGTHAHSMSELWPGESFFNLFSPLHLHWLKWT
jgi:hypothetical protein